MAGIIDTRHLDQNIETTFEQRTASADPAFVKYPSGQWSVANPHPGYGKDPNIINEFGHTMYPKWVKNSANEDVIVNSAEEEAELLGTNTLKEDGPTVKEYVEAGYKASEYPPKGYASKSTDEEIKEYTDKEVTPKGW